MDPIRRDCRTVIAAISKDQDRRHCWTPGGEAVGGTATAIKVATAHGIPVFNLHNPTPLFGSTVLEEIHALVSP